MIHYQRNLKLIFFIVLPIISFILGWSFHSQLIQTRQRADLNTSDDTIFMSNVVSTMSNVVSTESESTEGFDSKDVDLGILWQTWQVLVSTFLHKDRMVTKDMVYGATRGMVQALDDPYTNFLTPQDSAEFEASIAGEFEGIGVEIGVRDGQLSVISPLRGSPAEKAGLLPQDVIYRVNGKPTLGLTPAQVASRIRGPKGTRVALTLLRTGANKPIEVVIVTDEIFVDSINWEIQNDIAFIQISQFGEKSASEFDKAVKAIISEKPKGIIVDLRRNGGGLLEVAIEIISHFFPSDTLIVNTRGRISGNITKEIKTKISGKLIDYPLVVLIDGGSASASEIFAGAIQDHDRGLVLGEQSFGKGSIQNVFPLSGNASLKVTIAEWLTPKGNIINEIGVTPHEIIKQSEEERVIEYDPALEQAKELINAGEITERLHSADDQRLTIDATTSRDS